MYTAHVWNLVDICFNRYMVECEYVGFTGKRLLGRVLIDTWWNVNQIRRAWQLKLSHVLIDTWWNVNKILAIKSHKILTVLIDTWWNVNTVNLQATGLRIYEF